jgi:hypothetical protein
MGFIARWKALSKPRAAGSGRIWDNVNTPGSVGGDGVPRGATPTTLVRPRGASANPPVTALPNPEYYLKSGVLPVDPYRVHSEPDHLRPRIPVREPPGTLASGTTYTQSPNSAPGSPLSSIPVAAPVVGGAPTQIRSRDNEYDAGNPVRLQRGTFITPSQQYFDQRTPLPEFATPSVHTNGVTTNIYPVQSGWVQDYVPDPGMGPNEIGVAPPWLLSSPIHSVTKIETVNTTRAAITGAKAPKRQRSG